MDYLPAQDEDYRNLKSDQLVFSHGSPEVRVQLAYEDWNGVEQRRIVTRGVWPLKSRKLLGYRVPEWDGATPDNYVWSARKDLSELGFDGEFTVGNGIETDLPLALRRGR